MTRNDRFFKILFAIEIALLPLVIATHLLTKSTNSGWVVGLLVAGVLVAKIWLELFKNKEDKQHILINAIASGLSISTLVIFFTALDYINVVVCVFVVILAVLMSFFNVFLYRKSMPEIISAVDSCFVLFECLALAAFTFIMLYDLIATIALFSMLLTAGVSVAYKLVYICKQYDVLNKIKGIFRRR